MATRWPLASEERQTIDILQSIDGFANQPCKNTIQGHFNPNQRLFRWLNAYTTHFCRLSCCSFLLTRQLLTCVESIFFGMFSLSSVLCVLYWKHACLFWFLSYYLSVSIVSFQLLITANIEFKSFKCRHFKNCDNQSLQFYFVETNYSELLCFVAISTCVSELKWV